ncbi:type VI secretion system Vgr family protein [Massilia horti]|uniref:Type VI secretion system tip protein VgrG n=1 Tax=Massilia horti TaxID=2562153 RepID=A0A4Y9SVY3_9BURK|nr:type VI secretion system Vgr family protein [Massilia horti]TFW30761.1 type VI secretion system tip protein VgrG [Massilia horti]
MTNMSRSIYDLVYGRQYNRILRLSFPHNDSPAAQLLVNKLVAVEGLSKDFEFTVELLSDDPSIALKEVQGKLLNIELVRRDGSLRYFSGYVFSFRRWRSDGGITFYEAKLGPWLKFLSLRKNNYLFHGKTLRAQTETILQDYGIYSKWQWRVTADDPAMTDACQFDETDFNYLSRRWEAAGWYYWYEHDADGHTLIVASDSTYAPAIDGDTEVRFHGEGGAVEEDAIDRWSPVRHVMPSSFASISFNFKSPVSRPVEVPTLNKQGNVPALESYEYAGAYGFKDWADGDAQCRVRMEEIEAVAKYVEAESNNRCLLPGRWFKLIDHFNHYSYATSEKDDFLVLSVRHIATNNYLQEPDEKINYRNWLTCTRKNVRWRPGRGFNSTDTRILAPQTATVVGPPGPDRIYTDGYGRVRVQFHWDREGTNDERSSAWLRVSSSWAGSELGAIAIPRVGTEVVVQWLGGCPDRPIITGAVFNERNMPPWTVPSQQALAGFRSRELAPRGGNSPTGRSNHLILDDTYQQIQAQLKSDHRCSQLSLGHITRIPDTAGRRDARGEGWEIATDAWGVARAGSGMLITTEARPNAAGHIKDMGETVQRLTAAREMQESQAELAEQNGAQEKQGQQSDVANTLKAQIDAIRGKDASSQNSFPELSEPHLVLASPAGIATTTAQSTHIASDLNTAITTGKSVAIAAGDGFFASVRQTIRLFVQRAGMKLIASAGDIDIKALTDNINLLAKLNITQTANRILINATEDIVINGGGSYVKLSAGGIEHGTNGTFVAHAATHDFVSSKSMAAPDLKTDVVDIAVKRDLHLEYVDADEVPLQDDPIQAHAWDGEKHDTRLDGSGRTTLANVSRGSFRAEQIRRK